VYLNPQEEMTELSVKRFYRFVFQPQLSFKADGSTQENAVAVFRNSLPIHRVLTMGIDVHESWLVEATRASLDLDNLRLDELQAK
jgi:UDP-glucose:glycoprotein glucosyltransferase